MSRRHRDQDNPCKVYVGELGSGASKHDLEEAFTYYGHLKSVWIARNPPGFAFVEFEDARDAEDSCRGLDGRLMNGRRIRVEMSKSHMKRLSRGAPPRGRPFNPDDKCYECGERGHYARDCTRSGGKGSGSGYRGKRSFSRSRSRSPQRDNRSRSRSRSRTPPRKGRLSPSRSRSRSISRSRSRTPKNGEGPYQ